MTRAAVWGPAAAGLFLFTALAWGWLFDPGEAYFGPGIYDRLYIALVGEGRFDLPARVLMYEGHYTPDGKGYLYHGFAPLISRLALGWAVDLSSVSLATLSIWLWAVVGTAFWHVTFAQVLRQAAGGTRTHAFLQSLTGIAIWAGGPGIVIVSNQSLYHEPIAVAFAATAAFAHVLVRRIFFDMPLGRALILMAIAAGLTVHARPHVAVGLYLGVAGLAAWELFRGRRDAMVPVAGALAILGAFGVALLVLNALRFGNMIDMHGSFGADSVQYGTVFWGWEEPDSRRAAAFLEHGRFNPGRILPNLFNYNFDILYLSTLGSLSEGFMAVFRTLSSGLGYIRVEDPRMGLALLWPFWLILALIGIGAKRLRRPAALIGLAGLAVGFLMMLSYATITLRYKPDLFGLIGFLAVFGLARLGAGFERQPDRRRRILSLALPLFVASGVILSLYTVHLYSHSFTAGDGFFAAWSAEDCAALAGEKGLDPTANPEICRP